MIEIICYTDGSAVASGPRKGHGGFGVHFPNLFGKERNFSLGFCDTKTGRMEITALICAIKAIPKGKDAQPINLIVYSDSEYVVKSFTENRLTRWRHNNWQSYGNEIKNVDLWKMIVSELQARPKLKLTMLHIRGHQVEKEKDPVKKEKLLMDPHIIGNRKADILADYKRHEKLL